MTQGEDCRRQAKMSCPPVGQPAIYDGRCGAAGNLGAKGDFLF